MESRQIAGLETSPTQKRHILLVAVVAPVVVTPPRQRAETKDGVWEETAVLASDIHVREDVWNKSIAAIPTSSWNQAQRNPIHTVAANR
jgi:hypothetical protein